MKNLSLLLLTCLLATTELFSQNVAIGEWKSHLPYNGVTFTVDAGDKVYSANPTSVFGYNKEDGSYDRLSTAAGFSDIGIKNLNYNKAKSTLVIAYTNSNLDFLFGNEIYNYPFIQQSNINGDKNIYHAAFTGDTVILSCGFGIVLFDIARRESPATYFFTDTTGANMRVNASAVYNNSIYAATSSGVYRGSLNEPNLQDFSKWELVNGDGLPKTDTRAIAAFGENLYAQAGDTIYQYDGLSWIPFFWESGWTTTQLKATDNFLLMTQVHGIDQPADTCRVRMMNAAGDFTEVISSTGYSYTTASDIDDNGVLWSADIFRGLVKYDGNFNWYLPNGPGSARVLEMESVNGTLYVAPGEINASWAYQYNRDGFFFYDFGIWNQISLYQYPALDTALDLMTVEVDPDVNTVYLGSYGGGLVELNRNTNVLKIYKQGYLDSVPGDNNSYRVSGLALDADKNLWIANYGALKSLAVKKADGTWLHFDPHLPADAGNQVGQIAIDQYNTKWVQLPRGNGLLVYNDNYTIDDVTDDLYKVLGAGAGNGNLHTNYVNCIAIDKQGEAWIGTSEGVTIFYNTSEVFSGTTAGDATQPLVNLGGYYEQLLRNDIVNTIAVDGANRKWIGTNSGAFLISADGTEQLLYFNTDNSPLISNTVLNIEVDGVTGDVYFGTDKGIISFRYTATEGVDTISEAHVFPNPVRPDYTGTIAISGLTPDAEVRITDMAGRTIYSAIALGGQAVWDGNGYDGNRAKTGVYLVYSTNEDGSQTVVAKVMVVN